MVKDSMDLLELLRKSGVDGDVDFLREALRVLMDTIMDAEVSPRIGAEHRKRGDVPGEGPVLQVQAQSRQGQHGQIPLAHPSTAARHGPAELRRSSRECA